MDSDVRLRRISLESDRLLLREFRRSDWTEVLRYESDPDVVRYLAVDPATPETARQFVSEAISQRRRRERTKFALVAELKPGGAFVGVGGIRLTGEDREMTFGYLISPHFWGRGLGAELAGRLLQFGFQDLDAHRIIATTDVENSHSIRILETLGMSREGRLREHQLVRGQWRDSYLYSMLEEEWTGTSK